MQLTKVLFATILAPFLLGMASAARLGAPSGLAEITMDREIADDTGMPPLGREVPLDDDHPIVEQYSGREDNNKDYDMIDDNNVEEDGSGRKLWKKKPHYKVFCGKCFWHKYYGHISYCCTKKYKTGHCGYYFC